MTPTLLDPPGRPDSPVSPTPPRRWWRWALLALLGGCLVSAHVGCRGGRGGGRGGGARGGRDHSPRPPAGQELLHRRHPVLARPRLDGGAQGERFEVIAAADLRLGAVLQRAQEL